MSYFKRTRLILFSKCRITGAEKSMWPFQSLKCRIIECLCSCNAAQNVSAEVDWGVFPSCLNFQTSAERWHCDLKAFKEFLGGRGRGRGFKRGMKSRAELQGWRQLKFDNTMEDYLFNLVRPNIPGGPLSFCLNRRS